MSKLVLVTVGFDVNLVLRSLLKAGLSNNDAVLLVYSRSGGEYEQRKVDEAVKALKTLLSGVRVEHHDAVVSGTDFVGDVITILKSLRKYTRGVIVASLVGGMRIVIIETIVALSLYKKFVNTNVEIIVHAMREDGVYEVLVPLVALNPPELSPRELTVLGEIRERFEGRSRNEIANTLPKEMGVTESMVYKILENLEEKGLIKFRNSIVELTLLGKLLLEVYVTAKEET